ncbi:hypothetical protein ABMA27_003732 [Loxostege sticticalis]|uniref:Uncharacterized protein n=1 Tax=Loxostege sticticalis TaxID=481309 RepID=A0ABR3HQB7_LOXSC
MGKCCWVIPKKFLCYFSLKCGAKAVGIFMFCLMIGITIALIIQIFAVKNCEDCDEYPWKQTYSYTIVACIDAVFMVLLNVWLLWGIKKEKSSVVLCWVAGTAIWLTQSSLILLVLICMYGSEVNAVEWAASVVFALVGLGILVYGTLVVFAYWLELKKSKEAAATT